MKKKEEKLIPQIDVKIITEYGYSYATFALSKAGIERATNFMKQELGWVKEYD